jgi:hypothetical protein
MKEMCMEISVRKATAKDYNSLCELFDEMDALHRDNLPHIFQKPGGAAFGELFAKNGKSQT